MDYMKEYQHFDGEHYIVFNIIEANRDNQTITVNINNQGHHVIDIFELLDLDSWTYFEYGNPIPEKIYLDDFKEIK